MFNFLRHLINLRTITMIKNNITTTCPTYEELYHLDSSNQNISGTFGYEDGLFQRLESNVSDGWRWYDSDDTIRLFVDPQSQMYNRIKIIEITPNLEAYAVKGKNYQHQKYENATMEITTHTNKTKTITAPVKIQEQGRIVYHDRYVDDHCRTALVNSEKWMMILPGIIHHMRNNCADESFAISNMEFIAPNNSPFNRDESPSWKKLQWFEESKVKCKELC